MLLETFSRLFLAESHGQRQIFFVWEPQSWHRVYKPSAWGLGAFNLHSAALMLLFTVIGWEPKDSCLIMVKWTVCVTEYRYKICNKHLHPPLHFEEEIGKIFNIFPSPYGVTSSVPRSFCRIRGSAVSNGDGISTDIQRDSHSWFVPKHLHLSDLWTECFAHLQQKSL